MKNIRYLSFVCLFILCGCGTTLGISQGNNSSQNVEEDFTVCLTSYPAPETPKKLVINSQTSNGTTNSTPTNVPLVTTVAAQTPLAAHDNARMDSLMTALYDFSKSVKSVQGYRILVYSGTSREEAQGIETDIETNLQERADMSYDKPNFQVRVGYYLQRLEAHKTYIKLRKTYPNAIIIPYKIGIESRRRR